MIILIKQGRVGGPELGKSWLRNICTLPYSFQGVKVQLIQVLYFPLLNWKSIIVWYSVITSQLRPAQSLTFHSFLIIAVTLAAYIAIGMACFMTGIFRVSKMRSHRIPPERVHTGTPVWKYHKLEETAWLHSWLEHISPIDWFTNI